MITVNLSKSEAEAILAEIDSVVESLPEGSKLIELVDSINFRLDAKEK